MSARTPQQRSELAPGRLELLGFVVRSVAPSEVRMSRSGSWVPLDFAGVLQRLERPGGEKGAAGVTAA